MSRFCVVEKILFHFLNLKVHDLLIQFLNIIVLGDITRDKTVQACMRMRLLGKGHIISFWASHEADVRIRQMCEVIIGYQPTNEHVIRFISKNSETFEMDNTVHWVAAAYNYAKKTVAHRINENKMTVDDDDSPLIQLYDQCVDNEFTTLKEMYGFKKEVQLTEIANGRFAKLMETVREKAPNNNQVVDFVTQISSSLKTKLVNRKLDLSCFTQGLDEEQEKELENELEEERHIQRPVAATPAKRQFEYELKKLIISGTSHECFARLKTKGAIVKLSRALYDEKFYAPYIRIDDEAWSKNLYATKDFIQVVENQKITGDEFLRPVSFIARIDQCSKKDVILLLSLFECENLVTEFKISERACLHMYSAKLSQYHSDLLDEKHLQLRLSHLASKIPVKDMAQINVFSGSMNFNNEDEQDAYCNFMGLIPHPRTPEQQQAFKEQRIQPNGFVPPSERSKLSSWCNRIKPHTFKKNPIGLAIQIIEARHQFMRKQSHVASILEKATKMRIDNSY